MKISFNFFSLFLVIAAYSHGMSPQKLYQHFPEYHMHVNDRSWRLCVGSQRCTYTTKTAHGRCALHFTYFEFIRERGSWNDYICDSNTCEDCFLEQAQNYLESGTLSYKKKALTISPLLKQEFKKLSDFNDEPKEIRFIAQMSTFPRQRAKIY